jgi:hypothetical protein
MTLQQFLSRHVIFFIDPQVTGARYLNSPATYEYHTSYFVDTRLFIGNGQIGHKHQLYSSRLISTALHAPHCPS